mmetsp:Transcript_14987/g.34767  ORF Transcript_14987/g.34767 Transcript_14987/m.34767 type:complete len:138 (+) Transcript_14987:3-416(+)
MRPSACFNIDSRSAEDVVLVLEGLVASAANSPLFPLWCFPACSALIALVWRYLGLRRYFPERRDENMCQGKKKKNNCVVPPAPERACRSPCSVPGALGHEGGDEILLALLPMLPSPRTSLPLPLPLLGDQSVDPGET